jgi:hypothetical protein
MPCSECGEALLLRDSHKLECPCCKNYDIIDPDNIEEEIEQAREFMNEDKILSMFQDYNKYHLLKFLIDKLNKNADDFLDDFTAGLQVREFGYLAYLIKKVYERSGFGDEIPESESDLKELEDFVDKALAGIDEVIRTIHQIEDGFQYILPQEVLLPDAKPLVGEYEFYQTEFGYCFYRCIKSLLCGKEENRVYFLKAEEVFRDFDRADQVESLEDMGSKFYKAIVPFAFLLSADGFVNEAHYTSFPDEVSALDIREFLNCLAPQASYGRGNYGLSDSLGFLEVDGLEVCGERIFQECWTDVYPRLNVSEDNIEAHPITFQIQGKKVVHQDPGRPPVTVDEEVIALPRNYAKLIQFQLFPLLNNGHEKSGKEILDDISNDLGDQFEWNIYEYLKKEGYRCFFSATISKKNPREIDIILVREELEEIWFIEAKYLLPELNMRKREGIESLNNKFHSKVFAEKAGSYDADSGISFPQKVDHRMDENDEWGFNSKEEMDGKKNSQTFKSDWLEYQHRLMTVSNLVPSYITKRGVEFYTDVEFLELLDGNLDLPDVE